MTTKFFTLDDQTVKIRRNLLFTGVLAFIHFRITSLSELKVMDVKLPESFLDWALPAALAWFALNYFYYLYAEYTQWRVNVMAEARVPDNYDKRFERMTLLTEIHDLSENDVVLNFSFAGGFGWGRREGVPPIQHTEESVREFIKPVLNGIAADIEQAIKTDVIRITEFQGAIRKYNLANRLRFYILDIGVPLSISGLIAFFVLIDFLHRNHVIK